MGRSIMIAGNGELGPAAEKALDEASMVIRFNACRSAPPKGGRTDVVAVCNTGRPAKAMLHEPGWKDHPCVNSASEIWCARDPERYDALRATLQFSHPDLDDFCDDYSDGFRQVAEEKGKAFRIISRAVHDRLEKELSAFDPAPYIVPSSGLIVIADILENYLAEGDTILLAGFSHKGWEWHPWEAERQYIYKFEASGLIRRVRNTEQSELVSGA